MTAVHVTAVLRPLVGGENTLEASGATLRAVVADLERQYPALAGRIVDAVGLRPEVFLAIDGEEAFSLDQQVPVGAEVHILPAIAGG
ncbi:MAG: MoaD/ThiS family protein [Tepidiformaceae bacterium]